jgi:DNA-binding CsgD family transcriptional regulator
MFSAIPVLGTVSGMRWTAAPVYLGGRARERSGAPKAAGWALQAGDREFEISNSPFIVGRGSEVDLQLHDNNVSRRHAAFHIEDGQPAVEDLQSLNGTFVNRQPIVGRAVLAAGDRIVLGSCQLKLVWVANSEGLSAGRVTLPMSEAAASADSLSALSPREREVFALFAEGLSQREIASNFGVSIKTVETYRTRIGQKLGIRSRAELIRCALAAGILRADVDN